MPNAAFASLQFIWWNTSLSPPKGESRGGSVNYDIVAGELANLRSDVGWDVLGLCEVNDSDVREIHQRLNDVNLAVVDMGARRKKLVNDLSLIYDKRRLSFTSQKSLNADFAGISLRVGYCASFVTHTGHVLHVVVSHWPSRLWSAESVPERTYLGRSLYDSLAAFLKKEEHVVVMGDFNDDPHSPSLTDHFLGTRDRTLAIEKKKLFYNPFWRLLGESEHHGAGEDGVCGTYYQRRGARTRWHTFDQILISPSLLTSSDVLFHEPMSRILASKSLVQAVRSGTSMFDHLPISTQLFMKVLND